MIWWVWIFLFLLVFSSELLSREDFLVYLPFLLIRLFWSVITSGRWWGPLFSEEALLRFLNGIKLILFFQLLCI